jgi:GNAT superfamily N-acetyltransferase
MLADIYNNRHLNVFQGGDKHDFLHEIDPATGLNTNEMFRAVHDFYGHGVHGTEFGPKGEEKAWAAHSAMFSPLAQAALTAETRGQNSVVNYTPLNTEIKRAVRDLDEKIHHARRSGRDDLADQAQEMKRDLLSNHFQYAPQKAVLLPPEMNRGDYAGGVPSYIKHLIKPQNPAGAELTHFSNEPNLTQTDPSRYGTGIKGAEAERLQDPAAVRERTYFYAGNPERGEQGLGTHKYRAKAEDLYDVASDPQGLHALAREHNTTPWTAKANQGLTNAQGAFTDLERLAHEHGYGGVLQRNTQMPMAALFKPVPVQRAHMAAGGSTTDLDAMKLALMNKDEPVRMKLKGDSGANKRMIEDVYSKYPIHPFNEQQRAMVEGEGDDQTLGTFELKPSMSARNAVELSWLSAYPHKQGVGSRTLKRLQEHAAEHNVGMTLFPWEHGGVSQAKLMKFYRKHGFTPTVKGSKTMIWKPEEKAKGGTIKDHITITERPL